MVLAVLSVCGVAKASQPIAVGLYQSESLGRQEYAQFHQLLKEITGAYQKKYGVKFQIKAFQSEKLFTSALLKKELDMIFHHSTEAINMGFDPFLLLGLFNEVAPKDCIVVRKDSPYKSIKDLKGKPFAIHTNAGSRFYRLARFTHTNPLSTYQLKGGANDPSLSYMVSIGAVEGTMLGVWTLGLLSKTNPGAVKKLRRLECTSTCPNFISIGPRVPLTEKKRLASFIQNMKNEPQLRRLKPLMSAIGLFFKPYSKAELNQCKAAQQSMTGGVFRQDWEQEYNLWSALEIQKQKNRQP